MPVIVYPILSLLFQGFIATGFQSPSQSAGGDSGGNGGEQNVLIGDDQFFFMFEKKQDLELVGAALNTGFVLLQQERGIEVNFNLQNRHVIQSLPPNSDLDLEQLVDENVVDVGVRVLHEKQKATGKSIVKFELLFHDDIPRSVESVRFFESLVDHHQLAQYKTIARSHRQSIREPVSVRSRSVNRPQPKQKTGISFIALIPLVLTLMTITGAVYPAIDLTAGERERGTLESMIAAPIPRMRILLGKLVAIVAVAMLTAIVNLAGMLMTLWVFQFDQALFGEQGLTLITAVQILALLMLFAIFFSSVLLVITSFARSFKEGQAYLIPVMMVALAPSLMSLKPDLQLEGLWTVTPLVNIVLLARDVLSGQAQWSTAIVTIGTTIFYSLMAITMASRFFGTAKVLYGNDQGIGTLFKRPRESRDSASASLAMLCLALLFPATFIWQGIAVRISGIGKGAEGSEAAEVAAADPGLGVDLQLWSGAIALFVIFLLMPLLLAWFHRLKLKPTFRFNRTSVVALFAALLMGIGFGPLLSQSIMWIANLMEQAGISQEAAIDALAQRGKSQIEQLRQANPMLLLFATAIVPAICEELFFRGLLFRALKTTMPAAGTIVSTAVLFGAFHLISSSGLSLSRLLPTTAMGLVLGWVAYRSGSVIPGILLHATHNAFTVLVSQFSSELVASGWIDESQTSLPLVVLGGAGLLAVGGVVLLLLQSPPDKHESDEKKLAL